MRFTLIRHAEPAWFVHERGVDDPGLTERGHRQAARLPAVVSRCDELWVSPALRSRETVRPLEQALGMTAQVKPWLLELGTPPFEGRTPAEVAALYRGSDGRTTEQWWEGLPEGEPVRTFLDRIATGADGELERFGLARTPELYEGEADKRDIVVVSHAGTSGALTSHLLQIPQVPWAWRRLLLGHAGIIRLRALPIAHGTIFGLLVHNDLSHLPKEAWTW